MFSAEIPIDNRRDHSPATFASAPPGRYCNPASKANVSAETPAISSATPSR